MVKAKSTYLIIITNMYIDKLASTLSYKCNNSFIKFFDQNCYSFTMSVRATNASL